METDWKSLTLRDAGVTLIDCDHRTPPASEAGYPYVAIPQLRNGRIVLDGVRRITEEHFSEWTRKALPVENDVVLSRRCNPGETAFVPPGLRFALGQNLVLLRASGEHVYPPFLRWLVRGPEWWEQIGKFLNVGAVFDSLRCADVPKFKLRIPPLNEQRAIDQILGALDGKIELNRRMNETLEALARALYRSWFVDFDPVRAKAEGREHGLPETIVNFFPRTFQDSELGKIPTGWGVGSLLNHAKLLSGGTPKTDRPEYWGGPINWASAKDVSQSSSTFLIATERQVTQRGVEESATQIVPARSCVIVARGATTGRMVLLGRDMAMNQTCYALSTLTNTPYVLYCQLREGIDGLVHAAHGSVFDTITTSTFASSRIVLPLHQTLRAFEDRASPLFERMLENIFECDALVTARDSLLPKLIFGEVRVRHAERFMEDLALAQ